MVRLFGEFIEEKRKKEEKGLRETAELLGITPAYLSDIEKSRRNPPDIEMLLKIAQVLNMSDNERDIMLDYAGEDKGTIAPDLPVYILGTPNATIALRKARNSNIGNEGWLKIIESIKEG